MKGLKIVGFIVAGIGLLIVIAIVLALTPAVQTWAVRKAVAGQPGLTLEVDRVDAGFSAATLTNVRLVKDGMIVTAKGVNAKYNAWDYLKTKRINADSVIVDDLVVDLRNAKPATPPQKSSADTTPSAGKTSAPPASTRATQPAKTKSAPFEGLLKEAQLPMDVRVGHLAAKGRALLSNEQTVVFDVKGDTIQTGQKGRLEWTVEFFDATKDAALRGLSTTGTAQVQIASDRRIDRVEVSAVVAAAGPKLPSDRVQFIANAEAPSATGNEGYSAQVSLMRGNAVEPLLKSNAQFLRATHEIAGAWELAVRSEQLEGLLAGLGLPPVAANGAGKFSFKPDTGAAAASGDLKAQASQLQKLSPALEAIGSVEVDTTFDGSVADDVAHVDKLNVDVTASGGRKFAQISALQKIAYGLNDKKISLADPKAEVARISLQQLPLAWAQPVAKPMVIESGDVSVVLAVEAEPDGSRVKVRAIEPLTARAVTVRDANKKALVEKVSLTAKPTIDYSETKVSAQLADLNISMPAGDALTGTVSADVTNLATKPATVFSAQLQAKIVAALKPYLPIDTGPLAAKIAVEGRHEGQTLNIAKASATVNREGGALLASVDLQQPIRVDLAKSTFAVTNPNATAARVKLGEIPLAWAEPFVANGKFAGTFVGTTLEVSMRSVDDVTMTMIEPAVLRGVSATLQGKPMAQNLDLSTQVIATKRGETIVYDIKRFEAKQGDASLVTVVTSGEAKLGAKPTMTGKGNLEADVAALMKQPALADFATLSRGRLTVVFDANVTDTTKIQAVIAAKNLVAKQDNRALGDLDVKLNADVKADGSGTIVMPVTLSGPSRKSDLSIDGVFGKAQNKDTFLFTGKIASNQLFVDDFEPLAGLAPGGTTPAGGSPTPTSASSTRSASAPGQPIVVRAPSSSRPAAKGTASTTTAASAPTGTATRDALPFWKAANGKVTVDLKQIVYGKDYIINNVRGTAVVTDTKLSLDGLEGKFKENAFKLAGGLTFAASQPKPYSLIASADVAGFDVGAFLRAANPGEKPALETKATLSAHVNGTGGNIGEVGKNAYGKFEISGTKGTMYLLARKGGAGKAVNIASGLLAIAGAARGSDTATALSQVTQMLNAVPFDSVKMQIERAADLSFKLTSLEVLSPELRTTGTGTVDSKKIEDVANAPMKITLQLGAKGNMGYLLQRLSMLGSNKDDKGYQLMSHTFSIGGTPSNPDNSALWSILGQATLGGLGGLLGR